MSTITHLSSVSDLNRVLEKSKDKLTVIDFHATWCGPCHQIAPKYETLSKQYTNVTFTKCDVDAAQDVAQKYSIAAMPSFVFLRNGQKVDMVKGADPRGLENAIKKHASGTSGSASAFSGSGHTLGSTSASTSTPKAPAVPAAPSAIAEKWGQIDPQVQLLILFVGLYVGYVVFY